MKISLNWLKDYVKTDKSADEIEKILTAIGLEVEGVEKFQSVKGGLEGLVIGEVLTCAKHENSDHLSVTTVDVGKEEPLHIVCGAPNVAQGQKVVVATIGTVLYSGDESFTIKKGKIRGEVSEGMICAEDEIGVGASHDGIMVLPQEAEVGFLAKDYFKVEEDIVFEIGLTPNRIDAASHYGVARDLAAYFRQENDVELTKPSVDAFEIDNHDAPVEVRIESKESCKRYSGVTINNIKIEESPEWLQNKLKAIGMKPINNVVDITNFVLHETGQPLHAFDLAHVKGNQVIVKMLPNGTKFTTLDEEERELSDQDMMICNAEEGMCIGGVFGGLHSGVTATTTSIFLESAYFDPIYVRKTARRHGLNTDSSFRFERGADPNNTVYALKRAALLIKELAGGTISSEITDLYEEPVDDFRIEVKFAHVNRLIGNDIPKEKVKKILTSLDIKIVDEDNEILVVDVPPYRVDVTREADIIEEVLRIYGYNTVELSQQVRSTLSYAPKPDGDRLQNMVSNFLSDNGFSEGMSNSLTKTSYYENLESYKAENSVKISNPLSSDLGVMRQTLLFNALEAVIYNVNRKNANIRLYEFGNCYHFDANANGENPLNKYSEEKRISIVLSGALNNQTWNKGEEKFDFYHLKAFVENTLRKLGFPADSLKVTETTKDDIFAYGLSLSLNKAVLVEYGSVAKKRLKEFDIEQEVFYAEFSWNNLMKYYKEEIDYRETAKYPAVKRDLALLVDDNIKFEDLKKAAFDNEKKLLKEVSIFDVYQGDKIEKGKKSYALSYVIQDETKTLKDKQIDKIMSKLIKTYENKFDAKIR